jgi:hypothetical protein
MFGRGCKEFAAADALMHRRKSRKEAELQSLYVKLGREHDWTKIITTFDRANALREVLDYLDSLAIQGTLNNQNIPRMVRNYFLEMCLVVFELARVLRTGRSRCDGKRQRPVRWRGGAR